MEFNKGFENVVYNCDCLDLMKELPDKCIDLICSDPPYNIHIADWDTWETKEEYIEFMGKVFLECQRVLKDNGSMYFWHNDMEQISMLMEWLRNNTNFIFNSFIVWDKGNFRAQNWTNPTEKNNLRSWFNNCEYCLYYTLQGINGGSKYKENIIFPIREYLRNNIIKKDGKIILKKINKLLGTANNGGGVASAVLSLDKSEPLMITKEHYETLQEHYETLQENYESLRYKHNLDKNHNNIWKSNKKNNNKLHHCEKPADLISRIIKCSSNKGDLVLDMFAGSGTTAECCIKLQRKFILCENNNDIYKICKKRVEQEQNQVSIFDL